MASWTRPSVRGCLDKIFTTVEDLDAFCLDHFKDVYDRFAPAMNKIARTNALLATIPLDNIIAALRSDGGIIKQHGAMLANEQPQAVEHTGPPTSRVSSTRYETDRHVQREREERKALHYLEKPGRPALLCGPDQRGKSWQFERLVVVLQHQNRTRVIRLLSGELHQADLDGFLRDLALHVVHKLGISDAAVSSRWQGAGSSSLKFGAVLRDTLRPDVLQTIDRLVLAIDWQEMLQTCTFRDDAIKLLKSLCMDADLAKLRLLLTFPTSPVRMTPGHAAPLNLSEPIWIDDFEEGQVLTLASIYGQRLQPEVMPQLSQLLGGHPHLWSILLERQQEDASCIHSVLEDATYRTEVFGDYLKIYERWLEENPELRPLFRALLNGEEPSGSLRRLEEAGLIKKTSGRSALRYGLHVEFLKPLCA